MFVLFVCCVGRAVEKRTSSTIHNRMRHVDKYFGTLIFVLMNDLPSMNRADVLKVRVFCDTVRYCSASSTLGRTRN